MALLHAWYEAFPASAATVSRAVLTASGSAGLRAALDEIGGQGNKINNRVVGRWIERHVGRRIKGLRFERGGMLTGVTTWIVKQDAVAPENKPTKSTTPTADLAAVGVIEAETGGFGGIGGFVSASPAAEISAPDHATAIAAAPSHHGSTLNRPTNGQDQRTT